MGSANVGSGKSGTYLADFSSADDLWRKLADSTPAPQPALPRLSKKASRPPQFGGESTSATFAKIDKVRVKSEGFVTEGGPRPSLSGSLLAMPQDPWKTGERRLWYVAGTLMTLAIAVLTVFAFVTFGGLHPVVAANAPSSPIPGIPELTAPSATAPTAPSPPEAAAAPAATAIANSFRPPLPARVRSAEAKPQPTMARKHGKHKTKKLARN
jgi:hypothetical protein